MQCQNSCVRIIQQAQLAVACTSLLNLRPRDPFLSMRLGHFSSSIPKSRYYNILHIMYIIYPEFIFIFLSSLRTQQQPQLGTIPSSITCLSCTIYVCGPNTAENRHVK
jgi:hypothetical protein